MRSPNFLSFCTTRMVLSASPMVTLSVISSLIAEDSTSVSRNILATCDQVVLKELVRRNVDAHRERYVQGMFKVPLVRLFACGFEDPHTDHYNQAHLFG